MPMHEGDHPLIDLRSTRVELLSCCVCLEDSTSVKLIILPCCGKATTTTRCCAECLRRCAALTGRCPACRELLPRVDVWKGVRLNNSDPWEGELGLVLLAVSVFLAPLFAPLSRMASSILGIMLSPFYRAFEQALESVLSRGPV